MVWGNTDREWRLLASLVTDLCFEAGLIKNYDHSFVLVESEDRFIRPFVPFCSKAQSGERYRSPLEANQVIPSIGTSPNLARLYYGFRTTGFGSFGTKETGDIVNEIRRDHDLNARLRAAFKGDFDLGDGCWIAFRFLESQKNSLELIASCFVEFLSSMT